MRTKGGVLSISVEQIKALFRNMLDLGNKMIKVRKYEPADFKSVTILLAEFHVVMGMLKGRDSKPDYKSAKEGLEERIEQGNVILVAEYDQRIVGVEVIAVDPYLKLDFIYVNENYRRKGIAEKLFDEAEKLLLKNNDEKLFVSVHPNNMAIIGMLKKRGYDELNLLELRKRSDDRNYKEIEIVGSIYQYETDTSM
jgi:ribosomal protein S18 acetylase RimI-like enzyme